MTVGKCFFKNLPALFAEDGCRAVILPGEGGKIASFTDEKGREYLLCNPSPVYLHTGGGAYEKCDCSGFDDMFPTIDEARVLRADGKELVYPDHGEVCRNPFDYEVKDGAISMSFRSYAFGYDYFKTVRAENGTVVIDYRIVNTGKYPLNALWAAHCLVPIENGGSVVSSYPDDAMAEMVSGTVASFTQNAVFCAKKAAFTQMGGEKRSGKYYFLPPSGGGFVGYRYADGRTFYIEYDKEILPELGVWQNEGALNGACCVGLEPCTLAYDSVVNAKARGTERPIPAGKSLEFTLRLGVK